jgi:hypothetical protein
MQTGDYFMALGERFQKGPVGTRRIPVCGGEMHRLALAAHMKMGL